MHDPPAYFELNFSPNIELISIVRRFTTSFYEQVLGDGDTTSRVALATHELLENAVKYSTDGKTSVQISVSSDPGPRKIMIRTSNTAPSEHVEVVTKAIDEMGESTDPFSYYQSAMRKTAHRQDGSGLGLARIFAEAEMRIRYELEEGKLCIVAEMEA